MKTKPRYKVSKYIFIDETLFFPKEEILVIGDLHIGYDYMLRELGILIPEQQTKDTIKRIKKIFDKIKDKNYKLKKVVFLGDIKHSFGFEFEERNEFRKIIEIIETKVKKEDIIIIKGNHDTVDYTSDKKMKPFHVEKDILFIHGHKSCKEIIDKKIKIVVSGHLHPSIIISEKKGIKKEMYKCFLEGISKGKTFIVLPSFFGFVEGTPVNYYGENHVESFSIIPKKDIMKFNVYVIGKDDVYGFGKVKNFNK